MPASPTPTPPGAPSPVPIAPTAPPATVSPLLSPYPLATPPLPPPPPSPPPAVTAHPGLPFLVGDNAYAIAPQPLNLSDPAVTTGVLPATRLPSGGGGGASRHRFEQVTPAATWTIVHNLNDFPTVTVIDSGGTLVDFFALVYTDANTLTLTFGGAFSGTAYYL